MDDPMEILSRILMGGHIEINIASVGENRIRADFAGTPPWDMDKPLGIGFGDNVNEAMTNAALDCLATVLQRLIGFWRTHTPYHFDEIVFARQVSGKFTYNGQNLSMADILKQVQAMLGDTPRNEGDHALILVDYKTSTLMTSILGGVRQTSEE